MSKSKKREQAAQSSSSSNSGNNYSTRTYTLKIRCHRTTRDRFIANAKSKFRTEEDGLRFLMKTAGWLTAEDEVVYLTGRDRAGHPVEK